MKSLVIKVYSDFICPWCYLGKTRLDHVREKLAQEIDLQIELMPFILYPHIPIGGVPKSDFSRSTKPGMGRSLREEAKLENISFNYALIERIPNSLQAHRLVWLVKDPLQRFAFSKNIFYSYFEEGKNIEDIDVLIELAKKCGIQVSTIRQFSSPQAGLESCLQSINDARDKHISLVPTIEFNPDLRIAGLQSSDVWERYLRRAARLNI